MNSKDLEELRYDAAKSLLDRMSAGSKYQYALDKVIETISLKTEEELKGILKTKPDKKTGGGFGFN